MPSNYAGDPDNYPEEIQLPSDGDGPGINAADVNVGFEGVADRTAWLAANAGGAAHAITTVVDFTTPGNDTWVVPDNVRWIFVAGIGGGGAGGAGGGEIDIVDKWMSGGGGGGAGVYSEHLFEVVPGETLTLDVGSGGSGSANPSTDYGNPGSASSIVNEAETKILSWAGGSGGRRGSSVTSLDSIFAAPGGGASRATRHFILLTLNGATIIPEVRAGDGGYSLSSNRTEGTGEGAEDGSIPDFRLVFTANGGVAGARGTDAGGYFGGSGGGGGAASAFGSGGAGGDGKNQDDAGGAEAGSAPPAGAYGAGGGGGGGGGDIDFALATRAFGGSGKSGAIRIRYVTPGLTP